MRTVLRVGEVDAVEPLDERGHEVAPGLLAVGDDIDAGVLLVEEREPDGIPLALRERLAFELPRRPELFGSASQAGLGRLPAMVVGKEGHGGSACHARDAAVASAGRRL